jgi:hypothetical protein
MELPAAGIEYAHWTYSGAGDPPGTMAVSFDQGTTWHPLEVDGTAGLRLLLAGAEAATPPAEAVVLPVGAHGCIVRDSDSPEVIIRSAGYIRIVSFA